MQCCKASRVCQHNVLIHLVDHWVLLGICWWPRAGARISADLLVCFFLPSFNIHKCVSLLNISECLACFRLSIVFLGFDVFFVVFCVALACVIGIAVCCCLPCIIAVLYAVADQVLVITFFILYPKSLLGAICFNTMKYQEGASKEDIEQLTKFKFRKVGDVNKHAGDEAQGNADGIMTECGTDSPVEHTLLQEDAVSIYYNTLIHSS